MKKYKSKEQYCQTVNLKRFSKKYILIIPVIFCALLNSSLAHGQELIPFLKGKWVGKALYQATSTGFTSSKDSINFNISEQSYLEFKGDAESIRNGKKTSWGFVGYLGERGRNICFINQNNKKILVGYVINTRNYSSIKLYSWDEGNNRVIVYLLQKIESANNLKSNKQLGTNNFKSIQTVDNELKASQIFITSANNEFKKL